MQSNGIQVDKSLNIAKALAGGNRKWVVEALKGASNE
jgi:hypothetical protein